MVRGKVGLNRASPWVRAKISDKKPIKFQSVMFLGGENQNLKGRVPLKRGAKVSVGRVPRRGEPKPQGSCSSDERSTNFNPSCSSAGRTKTSKRI
jgi:hypothetical protein